MKIIITLAVLGLAMIIGLRYPLMGGLVATLPIKSIAYGIGVSSDDARSAMMGLLIGSIGSFSFACVAYLVMDRAVQWQAVGTGLIAWFLVVAILSLIIGDKL